MKKIVLLSVLTLGLMQYAQAATYIPTNIIKAVAQSNLASFMIQKESAALNLEMSCDGARNCFNYSYTFTLDTLVKKKKINNTPDHLLGVTKELKNLKIEMRFNPRTQQQQLVWHYDSVINEDALKKVDTMLLNPQMTQILVKNINAELKSVELSDSPFQY